MHSLSKWNKVIVSVMLRIEGQDGIVSPRNVRKNGNLQYSEWETKAEERNKDFSGTVYMLCSHVRGVEVEEEAD